MTVAELLVITLCLAVSGAVVGAAVRKLIDHPEWWWPLQ